MKKKTDYQELYLPIEGHRHYVRHYPCVRREGPVVLYLHGGPGLAGSLYSHILQGELSQTCTMVYWDMPGAGRTLTENPDFFPTMEQLLHAMFILVNCLKMQYGKQKIFLLGHGCGSIPAALYAQRHPLDIQACIGAGPVVGTYENEQEAFRLLLQKTALSARAERLAPYPDRELAKMLRKIPKIRALQKKCSPPPKGLFISLLSAPGFRPADLSAARRGTRHNLPLWEFLLGHSLDREKHRYKVPVAAITAGRDLQAPAHLAKAYLSRIEAPGIELAELPQAGHYMMLEDPSGFRRALVQLLEALG